MDRTLLKWCVVAFLVVFGIVTLTTPALAATSNPDSLEIREVEAYENVKEDGDQLYLITYYIEYETLPSQGANSLFLFRFLDESDDELATVRPYSYNDRGYGLGVVAFYFDPDDAPTWESAISIQLLGDPLTDWEDELPSTSTDVVSWHTGATAEMQDEVATKILVLATMLGQEWDVAMTDVVQGTTALSNAGAAYFLGVVPYLIDIVPFVLGQYTFAPDYPDDKPETTSWASTLVAATYGTIFDLRGPAAALGVSAGGLAAGIYYPIAIAFLILLANKLKTPKGIMLIGWLFMVGGIFVGVPLLVTIVAAFVCVLSTVWVIYKGAY